MPPRLQKLIGASASASRVVRKLIAAFLRRVWLSNGGYLIEGTCESVMVGGRVCAGYADRSPPWSKRSMCMEAHRVMPRACLAYGRPISHRVFQGANGSRSPCPCKIVGPKPVDWQKARIAREWGRLPRASRTIPPRRPRPASLALSFAFCRKPETGRAEMGIETTYCYHQIPYDLCVAAIGHTGVMPTSLLRSSGMCAIRMRMGMPVAPRRYCGFGDSLVHYAYLFGEL